MSFGPWYLILTLVNNLAQISLFCLPTHLEEEKEPLDCKQPGNSEIYEIAKKFINTRLDCPIFFCQKTYMKRVKATLWSILTY